MRPFLRSHEARRRSSQVGSGITPDQLQQLRASTQLTSTISNMSPKQARTVFPRDHKLDSTLPNRKMSLPADQLSSGIHLNCGSHGYVSKWSPIQRAAVDNCVTTGRQLDVTTKQHNTSRTTWLW